jgi:hypothetical protein
MARKRDYPERFPVGACQQSARWMVKLHPELTYVEGYLVFIEPDGTERRMEHAWNETPDGTAPTGGSASSLIGALGPWRAATSRSLVRTLKLPFRYGCRTNR